MVVQKGKPVEKGKPGTPDCGCAFIIDENGSPIVQCPTNEAQAMAFEALQRNPDVSITVAAAIAPAVEEEVDKDDLDLGDDGEVGFAEDDDFDDGDEVDDDR